MGLQYFNEAKSRCTDSQGGCCYLRMEDGHRCVAGAMIEVESEADALTLTRIGGGVEYAVYHDLLPELTSDIMAVVAHLQRIHDTVLMWKPEGGLTDEAVAKLAAMPETYPVEVPK